MSFQTVLIAAVASAAAALIVRQIWQPGVVMGAAITPVIVTLVSEALKRPAERLTVVTERRAVPVPGGRAQIEGEGPPPPSPPPDPEPDREDRFGLRTVERDPAVKRRRLRIALVSGLIAFAVAAFALTTSELLFGSAVGGEQRTTFFGGSAEGGDDAEPGTTVPSQGEETDQPSPGEPAPEGEESAPAPAPEEEEPDEPAPEPAPDQPAPAPAPDSGGTPAPQP